jgi:uncharacterized small protein (DUF1192 family)
MTDLMNEIEKILRNDPSRMYSREEILNRLAAINKDREIEQLLAELEVKSSLAENKSAVFAKCRGGTVYYKWNQT